MEVEGALIRSSMKTPSSFPQPPLLPLPAQVPLPQWSAPRAGNARKPGITVAAPATQAGTQMDSLYSVSPPPSCVPMPTSLLATVSAARRVPTPCTVEVGGAVDVGATDELRRLLRL